MPTNKAIIYPDDPILLKQVVWPHHVWADYQYDIVRSFFWDRKTFIYSANMMGKDYIAGFCVTAAMLLTLFKGLTCRIVTTSVTDESVGTLWAEVGKFCLDHHPDHPVLASRGGPLVLLHHELRRKEEEAAAETNVVNYAKGMVAKQQEKFQGRHAQWTAAIGDEASGLQDDIEEACDQWSQPAPWGHQLWFGNPRLPPGGTNFWRRACEGGSVLVRERKLVSADGRPLAA